MKHHIPDLTVGKTNMNKPFEVCLRLVLPIADRRRGRQKKEKVSCKLGLKI